MAGPTTKIIFAYHLYPALLCRHQARAVLVRPSPIYAHSAQHRTRADQRLETELGVACPLDISTTADIYVHGRREAKAGKATELLASQFVPVFSEEPVVEEQELISKMVQ